MLDSREQARKAIAAGEVTVNGAPADKPARLVQPGDAIVIHQRRRFVGRGGDKMASALEQFSLDVTGAHCLDVGSSTGGFTDCLLQAGAASVLAVDVGTHQLHERLRADGRVEVREQTDIRDVTVESLTHRPTVVVCDVSFIGIDRVFPKMLELAAEDADHILLIKPQFEAGRQEVSRGKGVIRNAEIWARVLDETWTAIEELGAAVVGCGVSPITGGSGNVEFLYRVQRPVPTGEPVTDGLDRTACIESLVTAAQDLR